VGADESKGEKLDRELKELNDELRVLLPGVQVTFAFLLTMPFTNRFGDVTELQRDAYFVAFLCATASSICLIAPSILHRLRWRKRDKERLLKAANTLALIGASFLALAITVVVFLISDVLFAAPAAAAAAGLTAGAIIGIWYVLPLSWGLGDEDGDDE
jgi:Kef-type K+ transport system membrane component KefB